MHIPDDHALLAHDHLNKQQPVLLSNAVTMCCQVEITAMQREVEVASGVHVVWGFMDGFLLYWDQVYAHLAAILLHGA
jgi:hypothetical protein